MKAMTPREQRVLEAVDRAGGLEEPGAFTAARRELGWTPGAMSSAIASIRRKQGALESTAPKLTRAEVVRLLPDRLEDVEARLEALTASQAALSVLISELKVEIREWTTRQPIYVEMRPRHQRVADGGEGGQREGKRLRKVPA